MPISQKIIEQVQNTSATATEKAMMLDILAIEDKGVFRFEAAYEKVVKDFIASTEQKRGAE